MLIQTKSNQEGQLTYFMQRDGIEVASITIQDGRFQNYSVVPVIHDIKGNERGLLPILNWIVSRLKGPMVSKIQLPLLREYGFVSFTEGLVWGCDDAFFVDESLQTQSFFAMVN